MTYTLKDVLLPNDSKVNIVIDGELIAAIGQESSGEVIDCNGLRVMPGFVDLHTHLREPGKEDSETVLTGSRAAVLGGFTAVSAMANTFPVADTAGVVEQVFRLGKEAGLCDVYPVGAVTQGLQGERLAELGAMADSAAQVRIFSDDGKCVSDSLVMRRALEYVKIFGGVVAQHAQDPKLTVDAQMNEGEYSGKLGLAGWPAVAEESIIARDILLADHVKSRLHICHLTTKGGVELVRWAKSQGIDVTAEVTPHHLLLTDELANSYDAVYKVNPPLRTHEDVQALREGVADGTIDIIATDHAPHPVEDKECEWSAAAFGMLGLESALGVVVSALIEPGHITWERLADVMSITPAKIGGYARHIDGIKVGAPANLALINTSKSLVIDRDKQASKSKNTPFHGMTFPVAVEHTIFNGVLVVKNGVLTGETYAA
jgi:dihydroorotase